MGDSRSGSRRGTIWPISADLTAVLVLVALTVLSVTRSPIDETPLRFVLGLVFLLFLPGYVTVSTLFPGRSDLAGVGDGPGKAPAGGRGGSGLVDGGITGFERLALSFGLSVVIVAVVGIVLNFTPWGIREIPILASVGAVTVAGITGAAIRRRRLPPAERFRIDYRGWLAACRAELLEPETRVDALLTLAVFLSLVLAASTVAYAVAFPGPGEPFTEFYLATENETGRLVAADYPTEFVAGEPRPVVVGVGNHERRALNYTIVVQLQDATVRDNETVVHDRAELDRFEWRLAANETRHEPYDVVPPAAGTRLRVQFLLYRGSAPAEPTADSAYRDTHLWINATDAG